MNKLTVIGDVHGKVDEYKKIINECDFSICVGDFGFQPEWDHIIHYLENLYSESEKFTQHWINMGNHDYIPYLNIWPSLLNHTWFANEELNYQEQLRAFDKYCEVKPKVVISHDCPQKVANALFGIYDKTQTRFMLEMMFQEQQPDLWIFGHHHKSKDVQIGRTRFVCLSELEKMEIEL